MVACSGCGYHDGDPPWWDADKLEVDVIRDAYRPKEVILGFLQWMHDTSVVWREKRGDEKTFAGYGSAKIANALIGNQTFWSKSGRQDIPKWLTNPRYFGKLAFVTWKEIKKQLEELAEAGLVEEKGFNSGHVYRITEAGRKELAKLMKKSMRGD